MIELIHGCFPHMLILCLWCCTAFEGLYLFSMLLILVLPRLIDLDAINWTKGCHVINSLLCFKGFSIWCHVLMFFFFACWGAAVRCYREVTLAWNKILWSRWFASSHSHLATCWDISFVAYLGVIWFSRHCGQSCVGTKISKWNCKLGWNMLLLESFFSRFFSSFFFMLVKK